MAMTPAGLKAKIKTEMASRFPGYLSEPSGEADKFAEAIATAVVEYIQANAQVPVTGGSSSGTYTVV